MTELNHNFKAVEVSRTKVGTILEREETCIGDLRTQRSH